MIEGFDSTSHRFAAGPVGARGAALAFVAFGGAGPAAAATADATRVFVSGTGTDASGCGSAKSPCATLQYAHDLAAPGARSSFWTAAPSVR